MDTATVGLTAILTPTITNDFRFNYSRAQDSNRQTVDDFGGSIVPPESALFAPFQNPATSSMVLYTPSGRDVAFGDGFIAHHLSRQMNIIDTVEVARGSHLMKFGFDFRRLTPVMEQPSSFGEYYWISGGAPAFVSGASPDYEAIVQTPNNLHFLFHNLASFAQDTWKASRRLTLTYGIRWDYNPAPTETSGHAPYVISEITNLLTATLLPPSTPLWHSDWKNFAPRVGASYLLRPTAERPTVVRVGFGQFYDLV